MNTTHDNTATEPNLPVPAGATADGWDHSVTYDGVPVRGLEWFRRDVGGVGIAVDGFQTAEGEVTCGISVYGQMYERGAEEARALAAALIEAADALDRVSN